MHLLPFVCSASEDNAFSLSLCGVPSTDLADVRVFYKLYAEMCRASAFFCQRTNTLKKAAI